MFLILFPEKDRSCIEDSVFEASRAQRGTSEPYDGIAQLCWDDVDQLRSTPDRVEALKEIIQDERNFIDLSRSPFMLGKEYVFVDN